MKKFDMNKLETALIYVQRIAEENDPTNNRPMDSDAVLNKRRVFDRKYGEDFER